MDLIPITDDREYAVCEGNFVIVQLSNNIQRYADRAVIEGEDIRKGFPELIGLESTCEAILLGNTKSFMLESITRDRNLTTPIYFNLSIKSFADYLVIFLEDVSELMQLKQSLMQQLNESEIALNRLQRFEYCTNKIIASMKDVLLITTPAGNIERINKSTVELFALKKYEILNRSINDLIGDPGFNHQRVYNFLLSEQDDVKKIEVNFFDRQQHQIHIEFDCFLAPTEIKSFFNCVYIGRDITARKQAETEIRKSLAKEKELRQLKSGFISMASHEFRNPLSSILLCVQNLSSDDDLSPEQRNFYLRSINDAALNMNSLLEDVLILSKAESGKQKLQLSSLNLNNLCQHIIQELRSIYPEGQINFNYDLNREIIDLDAKNLRHILSNLLSNALKYSPPQTAVDLNIFSTDVDPLTSITIEVRDRGIGIPKAAQKHLFESFYRASNVGATPGTGLGLSIVNKAVELCQGSITIDSEVNQGTTAIVKLPILQSTNI